MFWQLRATATPKSGNPTSSTTKPINPTGLPKSYYIGQEYLEDEEKIPVYIKFKFNSAVVFKSINLDQDELHLKQLSSGVILCTLEKIISKKLFEEISGPIDFKDQKRVAEYMRTSTFVIGYIRAYISSINKRILDQKYLEGHILARTISIVDIYEVAVLTREKEPKGGMVQWPIPVTRFPPSSLAPKEDAVFIRDLVDAMTAYFQYDLDNCVKKIITSLENCILHYKLIPHKPTLASKIKWFFYRRTKFRRTVEHYVQEKNYAYKERDLKILRDNILFIYHLRNLVVHDKLRIDPSQTTVCKQGIGTLLYIYQGSFLSNEHRTYIFSFYSQFMNLYTQYSGESLEHTQHMNNNSKAGRDRLINSKDDMDKFMFEGLTISKSEKQKIKSGKHLPEVPPRNVNHSYKY